jgi:hypothetical protein
MKVIFLCFYGWGACVNSRERKKLISMMKGFCEVVCEQMYLTLRVIFFRTFILYN